MYNVKQMLKFLCMYVCVNRVEASIYRVPLLRADHVFGQSGRSQSGFSGQCQRELVLHGQRPHRPSFYLHDGKIPSKDI